MNIQLGIYEIFSTIIPGIIYLAAIGELLTKIKVVSLDWKTLNSLSFVSSIGLLVVAYLLGIAFSQFGIIWNNGFKRKDQSVESLKSFKQKHKDRWVINFEDDDWHILLGYIRSKNMELSREIERHRASSIMLRNVSLGIFLMALISLVQYLIVWNLIDVFLGLVLILLSLLMIRESIKFRRWYYDTILSAIIAYRIDLEKSIQPVIVSAKQRKAKK